MTDERIQFLYFDRSAILVSDGLNFVDDANRHIFVNAMQGFIGLDKVNLGYLQNPIPPGNFHTTPQRCIGRQEGEHKFYQYTLTLSNGIVLELLYTKYREHSLIGRGTCAVEARVQQFPPHILGKDLDREDVWAAGVFVKFSWTIKNWPNEGVLVKEIRKKALEHSGSSKYLRHLPLVLHHETMPVTKVSQNLLELLGDKYDMRELRITVSERLKPITDEDVQDAESIKQWFKEIMDCEIYSFLPFILIPYIQLGHHWLYNSAKMFHRDISPRNMMLRQRSDGLGYYGVLNDFDFAVDLETYGAVPLPRSHAGTLPFMAVDLLNEEKTKQLYRHDLESFFWCLLWISCRRGTGIRDPKPFDTWSTLDRVSLGDAKALFLLKVSNPIPTSSTYAALARPLGKLRKALRRGRELKVAAADEPDGDASDGTERAPFVPYDDETLGGRFTLQKFRQRLTLDVP